MTTYKTYFNICNDSNVAIVGAKIFLDTYDYSDGATPAQILTRETSRRTIKNAQIEVEGAVAIGPKAATTTVLEVFENIASDSRFDLTLVFADGKYIKVSVFPRQAYEDRKLSHVTILETNTAGSADEFTAWQSSVVKDPSHPDGWGTNTLRIRQNPVVIDPARWMQLLDQQLRLCDVNLPGSHDSAAINTVVDHTPYATQNISITDQLLAGIRVLDVRLKVKGSNPDYEFVTCHGDFKLFGILPTANEFQTFESLLVECTDFLHGHGSEAIVMSLKIDDWNGNKGDAAAVVVSLQALLGRYPVFTPSSQGEAVMPIVEDAKGKIYAFNRIDTDLSLGAPLEIPDNTTGTTTRQTHRQFAVYVQDKYDWQANTSPHQQKLALVTQAIGHKATGMVVWNFGSGIYTLIDGTDRLLGFYINSDLLNWFGQSDAVGRSKQIGWLFLDYAQREFSGTYQPVSCIDLVISSNFNYEDHPQTFSVNT